MKISLLFLLIITFSGCAILKESKSKPIQDHNKHISGVINDNQYYAMDNTFSIELPYKKGTYEYNVMDIGEFYHENGSNVIFGPFGKDKSRYNIELFKINEENKGIDTFERTSLKLLDKYHNNLYTNNFKKNSVNKQYIQISGKRTIHWNLLHKIKNHNYNYKSVRHHIFAIKLQNYIAIIIVEKLADLSEGENFMSAYDFAYSLSLSKK